MTRQQHKLWRHAYDYPALPACVDTGSTCLWKSGPYIALQTLPHLQERSLQATPLYPFPFGAGQSRSLISHTPVLPISALQWKWGSKCIKKNMDQEIKLLIPYIIHVIPRHFSPLYISPKSSDGAARRDNGSGPGHILASAWPRTNLPPSCWISVPSSARR